MVIKTRLVLVSALRFLTKLFFYIKIILSYCNKVRGKLKIDFIVEISERITKLPSFTYLNYIKLIIPHQIPERHHT